MFDQGVAVVPISNLTSSDGAQVVVNLQIPVQQAGFMYISANLSAQVIEFNRTSPNRGFVVQQHLFNVTKPQGEEEQTLNWQSPSIWVCPKMPNFQDKLYLYHIIVSYNRCGGL